MNQVIANYFDDAHRGLQKQRPEHPPRSFVQTSGNVQLPPLNADSGSPGASMSFDKAEASGSWENGSGRGSGRMRHSHSVGALETGSDPVARGLKDQRFQQALEENSRLGRKMRQLQDQLSITSAKKEAFKVQATRLEKEFKKGREQTDSLQKDLLEAKRDAEHYAKESQEAVQMMSEMRKSHLQEVRLLQRGLASRGSGDKNRVNEVADLVDKLGRAVVQRDESVRDKIKAQKEMAKMTNDLRSVVDECSKLRRQNKSLEARLREAIRRGKFNVPRPDAALEGEDSDLEFEDELNQFERRFEILEEGPMGLDILASKLSQEKQRLEKLVKKQAAELKVANEGLEDWKKQATKKDKTIVGLNAQIEKMLLEAANLEEQIAVKRREIEEQVNEERARLEQRVLELQTEADNAREVAESMEKDHSRLTQELVKVHEQYDEMQAKKQAEKAEIEAANKKTGGEPQPEPVPKGDVDALAASPDTEAKTGEVWDLTVERDAEDNHYVLVDKDGKTTRVQLSPELVEDLDPADEWVELFSRVGTNSSGHIVVSELIGRKEVGVPPAGHIMLISIYKYDKHRFYFSGMDMTHPDQFFDAMLTEASLPPEIIEQIDACTDQQDLVDLLLSGLSFQANRPGGALQFVQ